MPPSSPEDFLHSCPESPSVTSRKKGGRPLDHSAPSSRSAVVPMGCQGYCIVLLPSSVTAKCLPAFKPRPHLCHLPILAGTIALSARMAPTPCMGAAGPGWLPVLPHISCLRCSSAVPQDWIGEGQGVPAHSTRIIPQSAIYWGEPQILPTVEEERNLE